MPTAFRQRDLPASSCWFAGAAINPRGDQADRFIAERFWEHDFEGHRRVLSQARSMQTGERITIQAAYAKKHDLSLETWGNTVSVIEIKAAGMVSGICGWPPLACLLEAC